MFRISRIRSGGGQLIKICKRRGIKLSQISIFFTPARLLLVWLCIYSVFLHDIDKHMIYIFFFVLTGPPSSSLLSASSTKSKCDEANTTKQVVLAFASAVLSHCFGLFLELVVM